MKSLKRALAAITIFAVIAAIFAFRHWPPVSGMKPKQKF